MSTHDRTSERAESLWRLTFAPGLWAIHFGASYLTAALWCGRFGGGSESLGWVRAAIAIYTVVALIGILVVGWRGHERHALGAATVPHDFDTQEDRHRFLGFATLLLSGLSAVATIYVAMTVVFIGTCR